MYGLTSPDIDVNMIIPLAFAQLWRWSRGQAPSVRAFVDEYRAALGWVAATVTKHENAIIAVG